MSAVLEARESGMLYSAPTPLVRDFDVVATASGGIERVRQLALDLAVQGLIVEQIPRDGDADELLRSVRKRKAEMFAAGLAKRDKPFHPIDESEFPHSLPNGWRWTRLGDLLIKIGAGSTPLGGREVYTNTGVKFLRSQNVWNSGLSLNDVALIPAAVHEKMSGTKVLAGDLLFNITGASIGRCAIVPDDFDEGNVSQHVTILRPAMLEMRSFLHLVLISARVQQTVMDVQVGVSREGLSIAKLSQFPIPIPPLAEQRRIVARVEELMKLCDALEQSGRLADEQHARLTSALFDALAASESAHALAENWQRIAQHFDLLLDRPDAVDAFEATILRLALRGLLETQREADEPVSGLLADIRKEKDRLKASGETKRTSSVVPVDDPDQLFAVPPSWRWVRVADICSLVTDGEHATPQRCDDPTAIPLVTAKNVRSEMMDYSKTDFVSREVAAKCWLRCKPEPGDILMVSVGATLGRLSVLRDPVDMVIVRSVTLLRPVQVGIFVDYLALHLMSLESQREIWSEVKQSAQPGLYLAKTAALRIALPPLAEQHRIVTHVEKLRHLCADLRQRLMRARETQSHLADALVAEVV